MRQIATLAAASLILFASQASAGQAGSAAVRAQDRVGASTVGANRIDGLGVIPTLLIGAAAVVWLIQEAGDSSPASP